VVLKMMWLKFLLIWRFFRMWALAEGVDPPENMLKCMSNNHSLEGFWRGWHASFNRWLVQYVYKPMGGREARFYSVWVIFLFVALWHDLEEKLLAWGLLNASFYVVEVWVKRIARPGLASLHPAAYALLTAAAGAVYIMVLIAVNLTGYATGVGGMSMLLQKVGSAEGVQMVLVSFYFLTVGVLLMQYLKRKGVAKED
jgi:D-alanyl-lipoteichoic acid acyltransferase DltB (MBOAT superfamily)